MTEAGTVEALASAQARLTEVDIAVDKRADIVELKLLSQGLRGNVVLSPEEARQLVADVEDSLEEIEQAE